MRIVAMAVATVLVAVGIAVVAPAAPATAADNTYLIDDYRILNDAVPGNGVCATSSNTCTLRAAIQEANATPAETTTIGVAPDVDPLTAGVQSTGTVWQGRIIQGDAPAPLATFNPGALLPMASLTSPGTLDASAWNVISAPVTLDLGNRLAVAPVDDVWDAGAAFYVNAPDVTIRNFQRISASETAIVAGPNADRLTIENGRTADTTSSYLERFLYLNGGADGTVVREVTLASLSESAVMVAAGATINGLTLDRITLDNIADTPADAYDGLEKLFGAASTLNDLVVTGSRFAGSRTGKSVFNMDDLVLNDAVFEGNSFVGGRYGLTDNLVAYIYYSSSSGANNVIRDNLFDVGDKINGHAITLDGDLAITDGRRGAFAIVDNTFTGETISSWPMIQLYYTGLIEVRRNIFTKTNSGDGPASENRTYQDTVLYNENYANNRPGATLGSGIDTWYPVATTVSTTDCLVDLTLRYPAANIFYPNTQPEATGTSEIDVYWTPTTSVDADLFLGTRTIPAGTADVVLDDVPVPPGAGKLRVQTYDSGGRTSQHSRSIAVDLIDVCAPDVQLEQAAAQADPTSVRDLRFVATFTEPIDDGQLVPADFAVVGSTATNARVTGVTRIGPSSFEIVARADASGDVVLTLPAGVVQDPAGNPSTASTSTDNTVAYVSPLSVTPASLTVAEPTGSSPYTVTRSGLPATADIVVTPTVAPALAAATPATVVIAPLADSAQGAITAVDNLVMDGTRATVLSFAVASADPNFDGLLLPPISVDVLDDDVPDATTSSLTVDPDPTAGEVVADGASAYTLTATARNAAGTIVQGALVSFDPQDAEAELSVSSCTTSPAGTCSITVTSSVPGVWDVSARVVGADIADSPVALEFTPLPASADDSRLDVLTAGPLVANSGDAYDVRATLEDSLGNPVAGETVTFSGAGVEFSAVTCDTDAAGQCVVQVSGLAPGTFSVAASVADGALGNSPVDVVFSVGAPDAAASSLTVTAGDRLADGAAAHEATVELRDASGNALTGAASSVEFALSGVGVLGAVVETVPGTYRVTITSDDIGTATVTAQVGGEDVTGSPADVDFVAGSASAADSVLSISSGPQTVGSGAYDVTATILDASGNPVEGVEVTFATSGDADLAQTTATTDAAGVASVVLTSERAGTHPVSATIVDAGSGSAVDIGGSPVDAVFQAGPADLGNAGTALSVTGNPAEANGTAAVTARATVVDEFGNPVAGVQVDFAVDAPAVLGSASATTDADGLATTTVTSSTAGSFDVTAQIAGSALTGSPAAAQFVNGAADPGSSFFTVTSGTRTADGADAHTITVTLLDASDNAVSGGEAGIAVQPGPFTVSGFTETAAPGVYEATVTATQAGTKNLTVVVLGSTLTGGDGVNPKSVAFIAGPPSAGDSTLTTTTGTRVAGVGTHTATARVLDPEGNPVAGASVTFTVSGSAVATPATATSDASGNAVAAISSTAAGAVIVSASLGGVTVGGDGTSRTVTFVAGPVSAAASGLAVSPAGPIVVGADYTVVATTRDAFGNPVQGASVTFGGPAALDLSSTSGTSGADGTVTITVTSEVAGSHSLTAQVAGAPITGSPAPLAFVAGEPDAAASALSVTTGDRVADGTATHVATAAVVDGFGNPLQGAVVDFGLPAALTGAATCTTDAAGTCDVALTSATAGAFALTAAIDGEPISGSGATVRFVAGGADASQSSLTVSTGTRTADGVAFHTAQVTVRDAKGNPVGGHTPVVTATGLTASGGCTTNAAGVCTVQLRTTAASDYPVTATVAGSAVGSGSPSSVQFVAGAPSAAQSTIAALPTQITADGASTSELTVSLADAFGNPVTTDAAVVVIAASASTGTPGSLLGSPMYVGNGMYRQTVVAPMTVGVDTFSFTVGGAASGDTATVSYTVGAPSAATSTIVAAPSVLTVGGSDGSVTVTLRDAAGNPITTGGADVDIVQSSGTAVLDPAGIVDNGDGTYSLAFTSPALVGTSEFGFTIGGVPGTATASVTYVAGPSSANDHSTIEATPTQIEADGATTSEIVVTIRDAFGNLRATGGDSVVFALEAGSTGILDPAGATDNGDGTYSITLTSPTEIGTATVTFTVNGEQADATAAVDFVSGIADAATSEIAASPTSIDADGASTSTVTVTLRDANGNLIGGDVDDVTIGLRSGTGTVGGVTPLGDGRYQATVTAPLAVGSGEFEFTVNGAAGTATATIDYVAGAPSLAQSLITADPVTTTADGAATSTVTVTLRDAAGNVVTDSAAAVVIVVTNPGGTAGTVGATTDNGDGTYTATLTAPVLVGGTVVGFTVDGSNADATATVSHTVGAPSPSESTISAAPGSITANGSATSTATVVLRDANGNAFTASAGVPVVISLVNGTGTVGATTDNGDGTYSATVTAPSAPGSGEVGFTIDGASGTTTATVDYTIGAPSAATSTITAAPPTITADGVSTTTVTVQLRDAAGSALGAGDADYSALTVTIVSAGGTAAGAIGAVTDNADGTFSAVVTAPRTVGSEDFGFTVDSVAGGSTAAVEYAVGAPDASTSTIDASPGSVVADGVSSTTLTVTLRDASGNLYAGAAAVAISHVSGPAGTMSGTPTQNPDGTWSVTVVSPATLGTEIFGFSVDGAAASDEASVDYTVGPPSAATSTIAAAPDTLPADGSSTAVVTVTVNDAAGRPITSGGATVQIMLASGGGTVGAVTDNGDGTYTATLTAPTSAGAAEVSFTVAGVPGAATAAVTFEALPVAAEPTVTAPAPGDLTNDPTPTFAGEGQPGATVTVRNDSGAPVCSTTVQPDGSWTCTPTTPLPEGTTTLTVVQTVDGIESEGVGVTLTVDTTAPAAPSVAPSDGTTVSGTGGSPGGSVVVTDADGNPVCTAEVAADGSWSCTPATPLEPGTSLTVVSMDAAGNASPPVTLVVAAPEPEPQPEPELTLDIEIDRIARGTVQSAIARGFQPGEEVSATMYSDPIDLGTQIADANGTVEFEWYIPTWVDLGTHTLEVTGSVSGIVSDEFEVYDSTLAATGADGIPRQLGWASLLLGAGVLVLAVSRRRGEKEA
ncbi:beta strand repeat-containing protein [Microbacterium sp. HJ5]